MFMTMQIIDVRESFGWTDTEALDLTLLNKNNSTFLKSSQQEEERDNPFLSIEQIQALSDKVKLWGYQLLYDDSNVCRWCIVDGLGNILWRNYGLHKAVWRLEQQVKIHNL